MNGPEVLILCGGKGTRSYPFTQYFPKVMMPINGTPILVHLMRIYADQGFKRFVLAAGYRKEILTDYFDGRQWDWDIQIVDTGDDGDTGDRIQRCARYLGPTFFATYGDGVGDLDLHALMRDHKNSGALATLSTAPLRSQYGLVVVGPNGRVTHFREKPMVPDYWINAGFFVFEKAAFEHWSGHNLEADVLPVLAKKGLLHAYRHEGFWKSMDTSKDQEELEKLYADGRAPWMRDHTKAIARAV
jgi:glucose-1-phosphate cytidylyltransferase